MYFLTNLHSIFSSLIVHCNIIKYIRKRGPRVISENDQGQKECNEIFVRDVEIANIFSNQKHVQGKWRANGKLGSLSSGVQ